jgi:transcriptional regulator with XRE-family HTH domain
VSQPGTLGMRLKRLRKEAGLTQARLAAGLSWAPSKISKIEGGSQMPTAGDIREWTAACAQPDAAVDLLDLLADAEVIREDARRSAGRSQAERQITMAERTRAASLIRDAEPLAIPGLLQTPGYARAIAGQVATVYGAGDIDAAVQARMDRQTVLYEMDDDGKLKRQFQFIVTEAALNMPPCPVPAMLSQLYHLLDIVSLPNVTLAIIPMGIELSFAAFFGFLMLDDTVIVEDYLGSNVTSGEAVAVFGQIFGLLMAQAVTGDEARMLITSAASKLQGGQSHA